MTKYSPLLSDQVRLVRFDGHAANDYTPLGTNINLSWAAADNAAKSFTAPAGTVAFYMSLNIGSGGAMRFTIDGVTTATATVGFSSTGGMVPIVMKEGTNLSVISDSHTTTSYCNIQFLGSV